MPQSRMRGKQHSKKAVLLGGSMALSLLLSCLAFADTTTIDTSTGAVSGPSGGGDVDQIPDFPAAQDEPAQPAQTQTQQTSSYTYQPAYSATGAELESAKREKANMERSLDQTEKAIDDLSQEREDLQVYLSQINDKLVAANDRLIEYEQLVEEKKLDISEAEKTIDDAVRQQKKRKEDMKGRIKYMYEQGSESYLDILLTSRSFSDFLNKANYFESINQYDRKMLVEYARVEKEISERQDELQEQRQALEILKAESEEKAAEVYKEVIEASASLKGYSDEIAEKEAQALAYEQEIEEKESDIQSLQEQYKKELALSVEAAAMGSRDLSDIVFSNGDIDLMAAMIECEAGGESYTGKVAVGAVILNRVRSPKFPDTVLEVLMQNRQFSPVASGRFAMVLARGANASCYQAAQDAMSGASPVGGCLFFRTPIPGLTGQQIGGHIFY